MIRSWLTQLWKLASPKTCRVSQKVGKPGEPIVLFLSKSKGLTTKRADGVVSVQRLAGSSPRKSQCFTLSPKAGKKPVSQFKYCQARRIVVVFRPSTDWTRPTTLGRAISFTQYSDLNVNLIQKHPHRNTQNLF